MNYINSLKNEISIINITYSNAMKIIFDFEGRMESEAFFALYAGLRMYKEQKDKATPKDMISFPAAEAYCMLQDLKEQYPNEYKQAGVEYQEVYGRPEKN